jgi:nitrogen-specific signal transduction histidine kinase
MQQNDLRLLRHSIRGTINALKLGVSVMDERLPQDEAIEFLDYIIQGSDRMITLLDQYDVFPDEQIAESLANAAHPAGRSSVEAH